MAYSTFNNKNRWGNFNNNELYNKYKQSQQPVASAPRQQQQQGGDEWNNLGKNIGKTWRESIAKRSDGAYNNSIVGGTGNDAQNYANMQNAMSTNDLGLQNNALGTTDWGGVANSPNAIAMGEPVNLGADIGANVLAGTTENLGGAMAGETIGSASTVAPELLAGELGTSALEGGAMAGEAIGAGAEGAAAGAGATGVLAPLAGAALVGLDLGRGRDDSIIRSSLHKWFGW